jgi:hypothetical protein
MAEVHGSSVDRFEAVREALAQHLDADEWMPAKPAGTGSRSSCRRPGRRSLRRWT